MYPAGLATGSNPGFGFFATFNYLWPNSIGGFYLGGGFGYYYRDKYYKWTWPGESTKTDPSNTWNLGANIGYKFIFSSGLTLRAGALLGLGFETSNNPVTRGEFGDFSKMSFAIKPDISIGYRF
jgi:hypothetical protein